MNSPAVINLKTDPTLKKQAMAVAERLGVSISAVLNNELRRFALEQTVTFELPEVPNTGTARAIAQAEKEFQAGDYHSFSDNKQALEFLAEELK